MLTWNGKNKKRAGVVTIEAALIFPILLLLTFGLIEYGWLFLRMETITNASRRGARLAATPDATSAEVQAAVADMMADAGLEGGSYQLTISPSDISSLERGQVVTVRVYIPNYDSISLTGAPFLPVPDQIEGSMSVAKEGPGD